MEEVKEVPKEEVKEVPKETKTLDQLEQEIRSMSIDVVDFQMRNLQFAFLQLLAFCKRQQKANEELAFMALKGVKDSMEYVLKSGSNAMKGVMQDMKTFVLETKMSDTLIQVARGVPWNLSYSHMAKSIYIEVASVPREEDGEKYNEEYYLTLKCILKENGKELFQLDTDEEIPKSVTKEYGFPMFFDTVDEFIGYLNRDGLFLSIGVSVRVALDSFSKDQRNNLAASAIFSTE